METVICTWCKAPINTPTKWQKYYFKSKGRVYCQKACGMAYTGSISSETMARTNRKYASARMKTNNPMARPGSLEKMKDTLKRIGHKPPVQGGNGRGMSPAEQCLSLASGLLPYVVSTHMGRNNGYPTNYKLDLANPKHMLAIEIDGASHGLLKRQAQDRKKEDFLRTLGWMVLRFTNKQALEDTANCVSQIKAATC
jgi:hypothetical protein